MFIGIMVILTVLISTTIICRAVRGKMDTVIGNQRTIIDSLDK